MELLIIISILIFIVFMIIRYKIKLTYYQYKKTKNEAEIAEYLKNKFDDEQ